MKHSNETPPTSASIPFRSRSVCIPFRSNETPPRSVSIPLRCRSGLALPAALFTLVIILLFIGGSAFATSQEARASTGALAERLALEAAEYGAVAVLRDWDPAWNIATPVGHTLGPFTHVLAGGASAAVRVTRTTLTTWWAVSEGNAGGADYRRIARRTVNAAFRLDLPPDAADAALAVVDSAHVTGSGAVVGTDSVESIAICSAIPAVGAGAAAPDTTRICDGSCGASGTRITGAPRLLDDSSVAANIAALAATLVADIVVPAGAVVTPAPIITAGICDTAAANNWGDPVGGACASHWPVIRALGDLTIRGGSGQGIVLANGDLRFENGALFAGLVIAQDDIVTGAGGGTILGVAMAGDIRQAPADHTVIGDGGVIRRSTCRIRQARLAAASPIRLKNRWWAEFE